MNENQVLKISLYGSIMGIVALYFVSLNLTSVPVHIGEITGELTGNVILVRGIVSDLYRHEDGHIFFNLKDEDGADEGETMSGTIGGTNEIKVVLWDDTVKQLELNHVNIREVENGDRLEVTGVVELYKGMLEIVPLRAQVRFL